MAPGDNVGDARPAGELARVAGIDENRLALEEVDKRRTQLWSVSLFIVVAVTVAIAIVYLGQDVLPEAIRPENLSSWIVVVLVGALALAFMIYIVEKELSLRRLTRLLFEERTLSSALSNRLADISTLSEVGKALNTTLDLDDVLRMILSSALEVLGGDEGSIMLLTSDRTDLEVVSFHGPAADAYKRTKVPVGRGIGGIVAETSTPMLLQRDEIADDLLDHTHPERGIFSAMCVPLTRRDELLGVLNLNETRGARQYTQNDLGALGLFAEHAAIAIGNASLFEEDRETIARLEELDRLKSDFVATVSHELKTPLTAIIGSAKTLSRRRERMTPEQQSTFVDMIERQGTRLLRLVEDILTTAQIEAGMPRLRRELVDLREIADFVVNDLSHSQVSKGRRMEVSSQPHRPTTWGDLGAIQQIVANLVENSLKYSAEDTTVSIHVIEDETEARIEVSDRGQGMTEEQLGSIFDRFRQLDSSNTRGAPGFGLGLFIVKSLVDAHNGRIEVSSTPGEGSTFSVHLPKRTRD
jgi:signal transduction histidine kinase